MQYEIMCIHNWCGQLLEYVSSDISICFVAGIEIQDYDLFADLEYVKSEIQSERML